MGGGASYKVGGASYKGIITRPLNTKKPPLVSVGIYMVKIRI